MDSSSLRFLTAAALQRRKEEEKVMKEAVAQSEVQQQAAAAMEQARLFLELNKRRKKRRKRRLPRTSSLSSHGRARRRHRQWHVPGWFSPFVGRPGLPGILAGMDQKDNTHRGRGICRAGIAGFSRAVFLPVVVRPKMLVIMAGWTRRNVTRCRAENCRFSAVAAHLPVQRPIPVVLTVQQTIETLQLLLNTVIDVPVAQVVQDILVGTPRLIPMVSLAIEILPILLRQGDRRPGCAGGASSTGAEDSRAPTVALVEKLVLASVNTAEVSAVAVHRRGCSFSSC